MWNERRNVKSWNFCGIYYIKTMETYCLSCKRFIANKNTSVRKTKPNRLMLLGNVLFVARKNRLL